MNDLVVGFGLVLVIEGVLWAVVPQLASRLLAAAAATPEQTLRIAGVAAAAAGVVLVWLVRGWLVAAPARTHNAAAIRIDNATARVGRIQLAPQPPPAAGLRRSVAWLSKRQERAEAFPGPQRPAPS